MALQVATMANKNTEKKGKEKNNQVINLILSYE